METIFNFSLFLQSLSVAQLFFLSFLPDSISLTTMSNAQHNESVIIKNDKINIKKEDIDNDIETKTSSATKTNKSNSHQTKNEKSPEKSPSSIDTSSDDGKFGR